MKTCSKCGIPKEEDEFSFRSGKRAHSRKGWCKQCHREYSNGHVKKRTPAKTEEVSRAWYDWYQDNKKLVNEGQRRRWKIRYKKDVCFRLSKILRMRITDALSGKSEKSVKTTELLGCPWVWAEVHLESLFKPGMTWENHGPVWHIDHIKPCAKFDLRDPEQQRICFHWTNLQPLFAEENLRKSDTYDVTPEQPTKEIGSRCCQASARQQVL